MYEVSEVLFTALEGLIVITVFALLSSQRLFMFKNIIKTITFVFIYTIYTYWITLFIPIGIHSILIGFLTVLTLNFVFNATIFRSLIKTFSIIIAMSIIEILVALIGMLIMNIPMTDILQNNNYVFICSIISKVIEITAIAVFYISGFNISWLNDSNPQPSKFSQILIIITSVLFFMVGTNVYVSGSSKNLFVFNIFSFIIYVILIIAVVMAFREGSRLEVIQFASELKKDNIQQLIEFNEMVAKERHEYKNHLNTIFGLCSLNKPDLSDKIKQYINNYANNSETRNINAASGNDFVDAIINVKYNKALLKGIDVLTSFEEPLYMANIDENIVVTIISNILENAFESIVLVEQEKKYISIRTYIDKSSYYISISNNGPMISEIDRKKIFNVGFSTKDNVSRTRGFGLSIVLTEIVNCGGKIEIYSTEEETEFLISLKVNEQRAVV